MTDADIGSGSGEHWPHPAVAWYAVAVLTLANVVALVDRQILTLLVEPVRADLGISDTGISLLHGFAFALFYSVMALPLARLADAKSRRAIITVGIAALERHDRCLRPRKDLYAPVLSTGRGGHRRSGPGASRQLPNWGFLSRFPPGVAFGRVCRRYLCRHGTGAFGRRGGGKGDDRHGSDLGSDLWRSQALADGFCPGGLGGTARCLTHGNAERTSPARRKKRGSVGHGHCERSAQFRRSPLAHLRHPVRRLY